MDGAACHWQAAPSVVNSQIGCIWKSDIDAEKTCVYREEWIKWGIRRGNAGEIQEDNFFLDFSKKVLTWKREGDRLSESPRERRKQKEKEFFDN